MKLKVCGMKHPQNIAALGELPIDYMGLIFYPKSPRFVNGLNSEDLDILPKSVQRVGVFVNAEIDYIGQQIDTYKLDALQLHGSESPQVCTEIKNRYNIRIIKAFNIANSTDLDITKEYESAADYFLFDTKTNQHGGSGLKFDWAILEAYTSSTPFFLSGGISLEDVQAIKRVQHPLLYALDLNSKFEVEPGLKDISLLHQFIKELQDE